MCLAMTACEQGPIRSESFRDLELGEKADRPDEFQLTRASVALQKKYPKHDRGCLDLHYTRKHDSLSIKGIKLEAIVYQFHQGKLSRVFMACGMKDRLCAKQLYELALSLLGKPALDQSKKDFWWASWDFADGVNIKVQTGSLTITQLGLLSEKLKHCRRKIIFH